MSLILSIQKHSNSPYLNGHSQHVANGLDNAVLTLFYLEEGCSAKAG